MKKIIIAALCVFTLASCDVKQSKEYKALKAEQDSILRASSQSQMEIDEMMEVINEVEDNFNQIKEAEKYLTVESKIDGQLTKDKKARIKADFSMIKEILEKNKQDIARLNKRIKDTGDATGLKKTIERLNNELAERTQNIIELQSALEKRDLQIAELESSLQTLKGDVDELSSQSQQQAAQLIEQDALLNTAYYMFGTSRELKDAKVISGGFLRSTKILTDGIEKSKFISIDIRETKEISVFAKKAKLLSDHPEDSYAFNKDANDNIVIAILDYNRFWSLTKFLIVEIG